MQARFFVVIDSFLRQFNLALLYFFLAICGQSVQDIIKFYCHAELSEIYDECRHSREGGNP